MFASKTFSHEKNAKSAFFIRLVYFAMV